MEAVDMARHIGNLRNMKEARLSVTHMIALLSIRGGIATDMKGVASVCGVTTAAGTGVVDTLAERGLVDRVADPLDRRKMSVVLTDKGRDETPWPL